MMPEPLLYTPDEVAGMLRISRTEVYRLWRAGDLESIAIGRLRRFPAASVREYVERLRDTQARPSTRISRVR